MRNITSDIRELKYMYTKRSFKTHKLKIFDRTRKLAKRQTRDQSTIYEM